MRRCHHSRPFTAETPACQMSNYYERYIMIYDAWNIESITLYDFLLIVKSSTLILIKAFPGDIRYSCIPHPRLYSFWTGGDTRCYRRGE